MIKLKTVAKILPSVNRVVGKCETPGCGKNTREGKPHCIKHITDMAYAQKVRAEQARRDEEIDFITRGRGWRLDNASHLIKEVMGLLTTRSFTSPALARQLSIKQDAADILIMRVAELGLARSSKTKRGHLRISPHGVDLPKSATARTYGEG